MSRIRIKNFGPIKEGNVENDGWIDIEKVTVFIGNQGSGKSTVAKLISTFTWLEKVLVRGDLTNDAFSNAKGSFERLLNYHRLGNYFKHSHNKESSIEYEGDAFSTIWDGHYLSSAHEDQKSLGTFSLPQIMYVPAERNFLSYVKSPNELKLSSESLKEFLAEFDNAKENLTEAIELPIDQVQLEYDKAMERLKLRGTDYEIALHEASSGYQSLAPLYLVSKYLAEKATDKIENQDFMTNEERKRFQKETSDIYSNNSLTDEQKRAAVSALAMKFNKTSFINIVEEPEQNLYPASQRQMLNSLLEFNNITAANKLIMTTHSPYIINYLSIAVQASELKEKLTNKNELAKLNKIVPLKASLAASDLVIYQLNTDGSIQKLADYDGIPSDENYLNKSLAQGNDLFDQLLEIEQGL